MATNPNPQRITDQIWRFRTECLALEPGTVDAGIYANKAGYHNTRDALKGSKPRDYSIQDAVDRAGPGDKASAFDWTFPEAQTGDYRRIATYSQRLERSSRDMDDPRLNCLREWYGQTDSDRQVEGWDCRYLVPVTSDSSHLWHIHFSFTRGRVNDSSAIDDVLSVLRGESLAQWRARKAAGGALPPQRQDQDMMIYSGQVPTQFAHDSAGAGIAMEPGQVSTLVLTMDGTQSGNNGTAHLTIVADPGQINASGVALRVWYLVKRDSDDGVWFQAEPDWSRYVTLTRERPVYTHSGLPVGTRGVFVGRMQTDDPRAEVCPVGVCVAVEPA